MDLILNLKEFRFQFKSIVFMSVFLMAFIWGTLFGISPILATALIVFILYIVIIFYQPLWGTYLFIFTIGFGGLLNLPVTSDGLKLSTVIMLTTYVIWITKALMTKNRDLIGIPLSKGVHLLLPIIYLIMIVSLMNSKKMGASIGEIKQFTYCLIGYLLVIWTIKDKTLLKRALVCMVGAGFIISIFGIMEGLGANIYSVLHDKSLLGAPLSKTILWTSENRINGLVGDGDSHGMYMSFIFILALSLFFRYKTKMAKVLLSVVMFTSLFNMVGAASRGAVLGFILAFAIFWVLIKLPKKWLVLSFAIGFFMIFFIAMVTLVEDLNIERFYSPNVEAQNTINLRKYNLYIGIDMFMEHPIIGSGPDGYMMNYLRYARLLPGSRRIPTKALNIYVQVLVEYGVIGFTALMSLLILIVKHFISILGKNKGSDRYTIAALFSIFFGYGLFFNTTGFFVDQMYWFLIALMGATITVYKADT